MSDELLSESVESLDRVATEKQWDVRGAEPAAQIQVMARVVVSYIEHVASAAQRSIRNLWFVLAFAGAVGLFTIWYFVGVQGWHWSWAIVPMTALALPGVVVLIGEKALSIVAGLPKQLTGTGTMLAELARDYWPQLKQMEAQRLKGLTKWRSYVFLAKLLWRLKSASNQRDGFMTGVGLFAIVANPLFWLVLIGAIILLVVECVVMLVACGVYALFF